MVKRKNQVLIDSDSSDSEGSGSDLESVSILLNNLFYFINLSRIKKFASEIWATLIKLRLVCYIYFI